ncbi:MAG: ABC transporter permease [Cellulomonadaceae bacterium]
MSAVTSSAPGGDTAVAPVVAQPPISWRSPVIYGTVAVLALWLFAFGSPAGSRSTFTLATSGDFVQLPAWTVAARPATLLLTFVALALTGFSLYSALHRRKPAAWVPVVFGVAIVLTFLIWAVADKANPLPVPHLLSQGVYFAIPLVFGSMAGLVCERSGIINIAIEGQLLAGAFAAAVVATLAQNPYVGLLAAPVAGACVAVLLAWFSITYRVNQIIVGVVLNVLVTGVTSFLFSTVLKVNTSTWNTPPRLPVIRIPVLADIPLIGPMLFRQTALVYIMFVIVALLQIMVFRSKWGLRMRSVGEHPKAADTVGIKVNLTRWRNTILGGAIAGLGGASFTIALGLAFGKEMTAGKGFIALAAMILGRWSPKGALLAALLFGFAEALRSTLGIVGSDIPSQFLAMLPYLATIFAVAGLVGRVRPPAAEGIPYVK